MAYDGTESKKGKKLLDKPPALGKLFFDLHNMQNIFTTFY